MEKLIINIIENSEIISSGFEIEKLTLNGATDNYSIKIKVN